MEVYGLHQHAGGAGSRGVACQHPIQVVSSPPPSSRLSRESLRPKRDISKSLLAHAGRLQIHTPIKDMKLGVIKRPGLELCCGGEDSRRTHIWDVPPTAEAMDGSPVGKVWLVPVGESDRERMEKVERWSWGGLPYHWLLRCPTCEQSKTERCDDCAEIKRMKKKGLGPRPRLYVWRVTWKAVDDVEFNRLAAEAHRERRRPEPEPEPVVPTWAGSDKEEMERRAALQACS